MHPEPCINHTHSQHLSLSFTLKRLPSYPTYRGINFSAPPGISTKYQNIFGHHRSLYGTPSSPLRLVAYLPLASSRRLGFLYLYSAFIQLIG
jgi:hypothetical protein